MIGSLVRVGIVKGYANSLKGEKLRILKEVSHVQGDESCRHYR